MGLVAPRAHLSILAPFRVCDRVATLIGARAGAAVIPLRG
jgi:hypothetical protein